MRVIVGTEGLWRSNVYLIPGSIKVPEDTKTPICFNSFANPVVGFATDLRREPHSHELSMEVEFDPKFDGNYDERYMEFSAFINNIKKFKARRGPHKLEVITHALLRGLTIVANQPAAMEAIPTPKEKTDG